MIILGVVLLIIVVAIVVVMVMAGSDPNTALVPIGWDAIHLNLQASALMIFLLGAATLLLLVLSLVALRAGTRRASAKRQELRRLRKLENERNTTPAPTKAAAPASTPSTPSRPVDAPARDSTPSLDKTDTNESPYGPSTR